MTRAATKRKEKRETVKKPSLLDEALICEENIKRLKGELAEWEGRKDGLLTAILTPNPVFAQTKMQAAKGDRTDQYKEGNVALVRTRTEKRILDHEAIRKTFRELVADRGTLSLAVADKLLGAETVAKFATTEVSYRYEVRKLAVN